MSSLKASLKAASLKASLKAQEGIRGFCSVIVVLGHILNFWVVPTDQDTYFGIEYFSPVTLFIVMSGFVMVHARGNIEHISAFYKRRFFRLAPIYYFSILLSIPMYKELTKEELSISLPITLTAQQSVTSLGSLWNGPLWTVSALAYCYAIYPFLLSVCVDSTLNYGITLFCAFLSCITALIYSVSMLYNINLTLLHYLFFCRIPQFIIGMCFGLLYKEEASTHKYRADVLSFILFIIFIGCPILVYYYPSQWQVYSINTEFLCAGLHGLWLYSICDESYTYYFFTNRVLTFLGSISYALYCVHSPVIYILSLYLDINTPKMLPVILAICIAFSYLVTIVDKYIQKFL